MVACSTPGRHERENDQGATQAASTRPTLGGCSVEQPPLGGDPPPLAARHAAGAVEADDLDVRDVSVADRPARQILQLQRRRLQPAGTREQVGSDEDVLPTPSVPRHRDHRLADSAVGEDLPGQRLVEPRCIPRPAMHLGRRQSREQDDDADRGRRAAEQHAPARAQRAPEDQRDDGRRRGRVEEEQPRRVAVGAAPDPVQRRGGPDGEVEVVRPAPVTIRDAAPVVVRERQRDEQFGGGDVQARPQRAVARGERNQELYRGRTAGTSRSRSSARGSRRRSPDEQAAEAVHVLDRESSATCPSAPFPPSPGRRSRRASARDTRRCRRRGLRTSRPGSTFRCMRVSRSSASSQTSFVTRLPR